MTQTIDWPTVLAEVERRITPERGKGRVATYIPALARVDPNHFGLAVALPDGQLFTVGDAHVPFSLQSISKVFTLALALERVGDELWQRVGREPSGSAFHSIVLLEAEQGKPRNPLINAGAIATTDHLVQAHGGNRAAAQAVLRDLVAFLEPLAEHGPIAIDAEVAASESEAGARNRALAHFMAGFGVLRSPVEDALHAYFHHCALAMSPAQLARAARFLACDGVDPHSGRRIVTASRCRRILALMMTCGHYDNSGDFAWRIGLPGKSGVGGGILCIAPGQAAIAVWSPGLNAAGTSEVGALALEALVAQTGLSVFGGGEMHL
ncbi:MAG: glutaminase [Planctomycetota bacterium]